MNPLSNRALAGALVVLVIASMVFVFVNPGSAIELGIGWDGVHLLVDSSPPG